MKTSIIPNPIPSNRLAAAKFYRDSLGWAIHPLHGPTDKNAPEKARGKKPMRSSWKSWTVEQATNEVFESYFGDNLHANLGIVVRAPHVVVDLDSKSDKGASVRAWLANQPHLAAVPRERTAGGAHLHFLCPDLPAITRNGRPFEKALTVAVNDGVMAELYFDGLNVVIAPSIHASGVQYEWEVMGEIPTVPWPQLQQWFGFRLPDQDAGAKDAKARKGSAKRAEWWTRYKGDLSTLDCTAVFKLGDLLDAEAGKHAVECPWRAEHSDGAEPWRTGDTSTVLYLPKEGELPAFDCKHAHCCERKMKDALDLLGSKQPGVVDRNCKQMRTWTDGQSSPDGRPRILLPGRNRPGSEFAMEVGKAIGPKKVWFTHGDAVVEVREKKLSDKVRCLTFHHLEPAEACTALEDHVEIGTLGQDASNNWVFSALSMSERTSNVLLQSPQFRRELPRIHRILKIPVPILHDGMLVFPCPGYDERFYSYTDPEAPAVMAMDLKTAKMWLHELLEGFALDNTQSTCHAVARLLTAVCRGLIGWDARTPFWLFTANRERLGKDYLAGITGLICEGFPNEDAPLEPRNSTETRKRITSAILAGRPRMHFANCRLHIEDSALEQAITSKVWSDRILGANRDVNLPNEIEFSISGNLGITYTADLAHRSRRIGLFFGGENPNARKFGQPDLHRWVLGNRSELLSALVALVRHWHEAGQPVGQTPFASFPEWAKVVGGIMQAAGLGDPCLPDAVADSAGGDETAADMKTLFQVAHEKWGDRRVELKQIIALVTDDESNQLFGWMKLEEKSGQTWFGKLLRRYVGRVVGGILLRIHDAEKRRPKFSFEPSQEGGPDGAPRPVDELFQAIPPGSTLTDGDVGDIGNISISNAQGREHKTPGGGEGTCKSPVRDGLQKVANVAEVAKPVVPSIIITAAVLPEIAAAILPGAAVALDIETYGRDALNPFRGDIRLLSLRLPDRAPWLLDLNAVGYDLGPLKLALESAEVIGHNLKFDALWLSVKSGLKLKNVFCSCTAARLLTAGNKQDNSLGECLRRYLDVDLPKDQAKSDWGSPCLSNEQVAYSASDVHHLHALKAVLERELEDARLVDVARLEMELLPVVVEMEARGFPVERARLEALRDEAKSHAESALKSLRTELGVGLNPNSPAQVKTAFAAKGVVLRDTKEETITASGHPLAQLLLRYRKYEKTRQQAETFLEATEADGRIHAQFNPTGAETGRFSCGKPNLQNVGRGDMRACFAASPGHRLVVADYSQIELRIAAVLAGEERMLEAYRQGADLHRQTAALVLNKVLDHVTDEDRQLAKAVNFGLLYGQSAKGLVVYARSSFGVELTLERATTIRQQFFAGYEGLNAWHKRAWKQASGSTREVRTISGRRRLLPGGDDKEWQRFTSLVNNPVQGASADAMKRAMVNLAKLLPEGTGMVSTIHDELIVEAPEREAETIKELVVRTMIEAMNQLFPQVSIEVDARVCATWAKTKPAGTST